MTKTQQAIDFLSQESFRNAIRRANEPIPKQAMETPGSLWTGGVERAEENGTKPKIDEKWYKNLLTLAENKALIDAMEHLWELVQQNVNQMKQTAEYADRNEDRNREMRQAESYKTKLSLKFVEVVGLLHEHALEEKGKETIVVGLAEWMSTCQVLPIKRTGMTKEKLKIDVTKESLAIFQEIVRKQKIEKEEALRGLHTKKEWWGDHLSTSGMVHNMERVIAFVEKMSLSEQCGVVMNKKAVRTL